jgi:hypothetical protein
MQDETCNETTKNDIGMEKECSLEMFCGQQGKQKLVSTLFAMRFSKIKHHHRVSCNIEQKKFDTAGGKLDAHATEAVDRGSKQEKPRTEWMILNTRIK